MNKLIFHEDSDSDSEIRVEGAELSRFLKEADVYDKTGVSSICQEIKEQQNICTHGGKHKDDQETACKGDRSVNFSFVLS